MTWTSLGVVQTGGWTLTSTVSSEDCCCSRLGPPSADILTEFRENTLGSVRGVILTRLLKLEELSSRGPPHRPCLLLHLFSSPPCLPGEGAALWIDSMIFRV